ncbi:alpha/beta fold hydrolase [Runella sp.]|uniref:alpha/beta fold hydrolase n=1 Tax=Runella sp. TaxID=1960881 RepID=UPI003D0E68C7
MTLQKFILLCLFLLCLTSQAQTTPSSKSRTQLEKSYQSAKKEFAAFEKKHGHFVETPNVRMHYLTWGSPSGVPLIWSHGSLTNGLELLTIADSLVKAGYYVIAIDYYGHGQTSIPNHEVSLYHVADDIKALMDKEKIRKAVIGGWSRGGYISTAFYDAYPERVLGMILEDGGSVATNTYYHKMNSDTLSKRIDMIFKDRYPDTTFATEMEAYGTYYDPQSQGNQFDLLAWITKTKEGRWAIGPGLLKLFNMGDKTQFLANILRPTQVPLFAESMAIMEPKIIFRNLHVPVLILDPTGANDLFPFEAENAKLQSQHPRFIDHKIYENTGHNIHFERKEQFIKDVSTFYKRVKF